MALCIIKDKKNNFHVVNVGGFVPAGFVMLAPAGVQSDDGPFLSISNGVVTVDAVAKAASKATEAAQAQADLDVRNTRRQQLKELAVDIDSVKDVAEMKTALIRILKLFAEEAGIK